MFKKPGFVLLISCFLLASIPQARAEDDYLVENPPVERPKTTFEKYSDAYEVYQRECNQIGVTQDESKCRSLGLMKDMLAIQLAKENVGQEFEKSGSVGLERAATLARELEKRIRALYNAHANPETMTLASINSLIDESELKDLNTQVQGLVEEVKAVRPELNVYSGAWMRILQDLKEIAMAPEIKEAGFLRQSVHSTSSPTTAFRKN